MNNERGTWMRFRSLNRLWAKWILLGSLSSFMLWSNPAGTVPAPPQQLLDELKKPNCDNALVVAKLYEDYDKGLGKEKPAANVAADVAVRLAVCLPVAIAAARKVGGGGPIGSASVVIGLAGEADRLAALRFVQAMNSMIFLARDLGRNTDPEVRGLWTKYNAGSASSELGARAYSIRSQAITPDDEQKYKDLLKKPKEELTSDDRALIERIKSWDASL